jgi:hypothetical protein
LLHRLSSDPEIFTPVIFPEHNILFGHAFPRDVEPAFVCAPDHTRKRRARRAVLPRTRQKSRLMAAGCS